MSSEFIDRKDDITEILEEPEVIESNMSEPIDSQSLVEAESLPFGIENSELEQLIESAGYAYDPVQDIFFSVMNPWQRSLGYTRLYDEAAAPLSMIIDCEPIYFEYRGEKWMIGIWKGQYGMVTGGEIGIYPAGFEIDIPGVYTGTFYHCAGDQDLLQMSFTLNKDGKTLFKRWGKHWWLTGFVLGEFSEPSELTMDLSITLKDKDMKDAFLDGLLQAGYQESQLTINYNTVSFTFDKPVTRQPYTRTILTDWIIQRKNELFCNKYKEITSAFTNLPDKFKAIEEQAPQLYNNMIRIGKSKREFEMYESVVKLAALVASLVTARKKGNEEEIQKVAALSDVQSIYPRIWTLS